MKRDKIIYWVTTTIVVFSLAFAGYAYLTNPAMKDGFNHLGFPAYFRVELGLAKLIGALALIVPNVPYRVKEWAYAGVAITFVSAAIAHISSGDAIRMVITPLVFFIFLAVSYWFYHKLHSFSGQLV